MSTAQSPTQPPSPPATMRLFFAVPLAPALQARIASWRDGLRLPRLAARVPAPNMHITLAFLGEVPREEVAALLRIGAHVAASQGTGEIVLNRVNCWRNGVLHLAPSARRGKGNGEGGGDGNVGRSEGRDQHGHVSHPQVSTHTQSQNRFQPLLEDDAEVTPTPVSTSRRTVNSAATPSTAGFPQPSTSSQAASPQASTSPRNTSGNPPLNREAVYALAASLTSELYEAGFGVDRRAFSAHLTLARRADRVRARARFRVPVDTLVLYESRDEGRGVVYTPLEEWALTGPGEEEGGDEGSAVRESNVMEGGGKAEVVEIEERRESVEYVERGSEGRKEIDVDSVDRMEGHAELERILGISEPDHEPLGPPTTS